jgi:hypothetical protein
MLRLAANIVIGFFIAAIGIGLWRGRIGGPASVGAADRAHIAREELMRMKMMEEVGGKELDLEFLDREFAVSAQLAWAEYDAANDQAGRAAAVDGHFQRMAHRALRRQSIFDGPPQSGFYKKLRQHLAMARLWRGLVPK